MRGPIFMRAFIVAAARFWHGQTQSAGGRVDQCVRSMAKGGWLDAQRQSTVDQSQAAVHQGPALFDCAALRSRQV